MRTVLSALRANQNSNTENSKVITMSWQMLMLPVRMVGTRGWGNYSVGSSLQVIPFYIIQWFETKVHSVNSPERNHKPTHRSLLTLEINTIICFPTAAIRLVQYVSLKPQQHRWSESFVNTFRLSFGLAMAAGLGLGFTMLKASLFHPTLSEKSNHLRGLIQSSSKQCDLCLISKNKKTPWLN